MWIDKFNDKNKTKLLPPSNPVKIFLIVENY